MIRAHYLKTVVLLGMSVTLSACVPLNLGPVSTIHKLTFFKLRGNEAPQDYADRLRTFLRDNKICQGSKIGSGADTISEWFDLSTLEIVVVNAVDAKPPDKASQQEVLKELSPRNDTLIAAQRIQNNQRLYAYRQRLRRYSKPTFFKGLLTATFGKRNEEGNPFLDQQFYVVSLTARYAGGAPVSCAKDLGEQLIQLHPVKGKPPQPLADSYGDDDESSFPRGGWIIGAGDEAEALPNLNPDPTLVGLPTYNPNYAVLATDRVFNKTQANEQVQEWNPSSPSDRSEIERRLANKHPFGNSAGGFTFDFAKPGFDFAKPNQVNTLMNRVLVAIIDTGVEAAAIGRITSLESDQRSSFKDRLLEQRIVRFISVPNSGSKNSSDSNKDDCPTSDVSNNPTDQSKAPPANADANQQAQKPDPVIYKYNPSCHLDIEGVEDKN